MHFNREDDPKGREERRGLGSNLASLREASWWTTARGAASREMGPCAVAFVAAASGGGLGAEAEEAAGLGGEHGRVGDDDLAVGLHSGCSDG